MDYLTVPFVEVKSGERSGQVSGYGSTFGNVDLQDDVIEPGAFAATIQENPKGWPMLFGHLMARPVGFWTSAKEDSRGLFLQGEFTMAAPDGASAHALVTHGARLGQPFGLSIGYRIPDGGSRVQGGVRRLSALSVLEVSLAAVPANQLARVVSVKSAAAAISDLAECQTPADVTRLLRSVGMSRKQAGDWLHMVRSGEDEPEESSAADIAKAFRASQERAGERHQAIAWQCFGAAHAETLKTGVYPMKGDLGLFDETRRAIANRKADEVLAQMASCSDGAEVEALLYRLGWKEDDIREFKATGYCHP